jgi:DNA-binding MarR family transcriptional regulator
MTAQPRTARQPATRRRRWNAKLLPDFHTAPGHLFRRGRQLHDALWLIHVDDTLTPLQYAVLTALELEPGIDQRTLGDRIALDKSTIGDLLARLGNRGLIKRRSDDRDGRRRLLEVTDEGREVLYCAAPGVAKIGELMLSVLDEKERKDLMRLMDKIVYSADSQMLLSD